MESENRTTSTIELTDAELWVQLIFFYVFLAGVVTTSFSVMVWLGIVREKKLRNRFYTIVGCLSFCRTLLCLQYLVLGIWRSLRTVSLFDPMQTRIVCHSLHLCLLCGNSIEMMLLLFLVIDGYISVMESLHYRQWRWQSALHICVGIFLATTVFKMSFSYSLVDLNEVVNCIDLYSAPSDAFNEFSQDLDFVLVGLIVVVYLSLIIHLRCKAARVKQRTGVDANDPVSRSMQRQLMLMPMIRNQVLMHCSFALTSKLLLILGVVVPAPAAYRQRLTALGGVFNCLDLFGDVTSVLIGNRSLRAACLPCIRWKDAGRLQITPDDRNQNKRRNDTSSNSRRV